MIQRAKAFLLAGKTRLYELGAKMLQVMLILRRKGKI
jgi:hypothetical protein